MKLKIILKGLLIGIGKVIPGVSGSIIAISLGIYEKAIECINNFFKDIKNNLKFLIPLGTGIIISIILSSKIVINLLDNYYVPTILFFLGLIIGGIDDITKETSKRYTHLTVIFCILMLIISLISIKHELTFNNQIELFLYYIIIGIIDSITMIIPGISGTAILMMIGCYKTLMNVLSNLTDINQLIYNISILLPFSIGMIIGILITIKLVNYLFNNHYTKTYNIILGFLISSIIYMFITTLQHKYSLLQIIIGFILLIIGYIITKKINHN